MDKKIFKSKLQYPIKQTENLFLECFTNEVKFEELGLGQGAHQELSGHAN